MWAGLADHRTQPCRRGACLTGATVGSDKVLRRQVVGTVRSGDMYRDAVVVLVETGQDVTPTNVSVVFAGPLGKHLNKPPLLNGDHEQLRFGHHREIQWKACEHRARSGIWRLCRPGERAVQTSVIKNPNPLAHNAVDSRVRVGARHGIQTTGRIPASPSSQAGIRPFGPVPAMTTSVI